MPACNRNKLVYKFRNEDVSFAISSYVLTVIEVIQNSKGRCLWWLLNRTDREGEASIPLLLEKFSYFVQKQH